MIVFPNAKINLGLYITKKRQDGYHDLETFFYPVRGLNDVLEIVVNKEDTTDSFNISGIKLEGITEDNIVLGALHLMRQTHKIPPLRIHLHKTIPAGAGLGGGSADAAFMLKALNGLFQLKIKNQELEIMAGKLGADCAFFIGNVPSLASGIGNVLTPIPLRLKNHWLLVVVPPIHISTAQAYQSVTPQKPENPLKKGLLSAKTEWAGLIKNDFENPLFKVYPELLEIKNKMYAQGAFYAALSGSGSALFGLFKEEPHIQWPEEFFVYKGHLK